MNKKFLVLSALAGFFFLSRCNEEEATGIDKELFDEATASAGFSYYINTPAITPSSPQSAHNAYMRVRFNSVAQSALDNVTGELPAGASFPNGSMIVKELYDSPTEPVVLYAIMKKDSSNANAGANWLWAEIKPDRSVAFPATKKGSSCTGCHSMNSRDYTRIFDIF
ncbi:MAG TPA: cytochrome P460 family protein [Chitinophagales bacterium]|nr:cytochrome P460 family protein [Chitinophagales bacterium]